MINYNILLSRLLGVRRAALRPGLTASHRACCPLCQSEGPRPGRDPSLSVSLSESGNILAWCHKCEKPGHEILRHIGIQQSTKSTSQHAKAKPEPSPADWISTAAAADALGMVVVQVINGSYHNDQERVLDAVCKVHQRLETFKSACRDAMRADGRKERRRHEPAE